MAKFHISSKNHILKITILTEFTFSKPHFWQNSQFENLIFHKNSHFLTIKFQGFLDYMLNLAQCSVPWIAIKSVNVVLYWNE